jgi:hypothetical protein
MKLNPQSRRRFLGDAAITLTAGGMGILPSVIGQSIKTKPAAIMPETNNALGQMKQVDAGVLNIGYAEEGSPGGTPVILLHGWPYDIYSYAEVAPLLASAGFRVLIPYLRGYGTTRFLSEKTLRNGQQSVVAVDILRFMDALNIKKAVIAGFDWGHEQQPSWLRFGRSDVRHWYQ